MRRFSRRAYRGVSLPTVLVNALLYKPVAVSVAAAGGYPNANMNDGNASTRWISDPQDNVTATITLEAKYQFQKFVITWAGDCTKNYNLQVSDDNSTWTTIYTGTTTNNSRETTTITSFSDIAAGMYVRIVCIDRWNAAYGNSIWEIEGWGYKSGAVPPRPVTNDMPINLVVSNVSSSGASVQWGAPASPSGSIQGYNIYRDGVKTNTAPITALSYNFSGLTSGTTYTIRIATVIGDIEKASDTAQFTTQSVVAPPSGAYLDFAGRRRPLMARDSWVYANHHLGGTDPMSAAVNPELISSLRGWNGTVTVNVPTESWTIAFYIATPSTPRYYIDCSSWEWAAYKTDLHHADGSGQFDKVPLMPNWVADQSSGTDKSMIVYLPEEDTLWEIWVYQGISDANNRIAKANEGGRLLNYSQNRLGVFTGSGGKYGVTGASISLASTMLMADDIARGYIDHAMYLAVDVNWVNGGIYPPAITTDGWDGANGSYLSEGMRFVLPPDLDLTPYNLPPVAKLVGEAMKAGHPLLIADRTGGGGNLGAEYSQSLNISTNGSIPVSWYSDKWGGVEPYAQFYNFPFDKARLVNVNWMP